MIKLIGASGHDNGYEETFAIDGEAQIDTPWPRYGQDAVKVMDLLNRLPSGTCDRVLGRLLAERCKIAHEESRAILSAALDIILRCNNQTLNGWAEANKIGLIPYGECMTVPDQDYPDRSGLWALADYVVTSVTGGTIWLAPRKR